MSKNDRVPDLRAGIIFAAARVVGYILLILISAIVLVAVTS